MVTRCGMVVIAGVVSIVPPAVAQDRAIRRTPVVDVFEQTRDAVVNISSTEVVTVRNSGRGRVFHDLFDLPSGPRTRQFERQSVGSGFVIHPEGYIVTNSHVVARTTDVAVTFADGREYPARVLASDPGNDIGLIKIDTDRALPAIDLGRSHDLMIGETVIAIGNPLGYQNTVTAGVVSAIDRDLNLGSGMELTELIQTDASINPGNSGGPLLNVLGELIGINTAIRADAQNIGFAIPVDKLRELLPDLIDVERRFRLRSGLQVARFDVPRVTAVEPGSPADAAGIRVGDVLSSIDGEPVREGIDFDISLIGRQPGESIQVAVARGERDVATRLQLAARPAPDGAVLSRSRLGMEVNPLADDLARQLGLPAGAGLLVLRVDPEGPAAAAGLERRDVLVALGRQGVNTMDELGQLLDAVPEGATVPISVIRVDRYGKMRLTRQIRVE